MRRRACGWRLHEVLFGFRLCFVLGDARHGAEGDRPLRCFGVSCTEARVAGGGGRVVSGMMCGVVGVWQVVAGFVAVSGAFLLCARREGRGWYPAVWELPGVHVYPMEEPRHPLLRELEEELGILASLSAAPWMTVENAEARVQVWRVTEGTGQLRNVKWAEHRALKRVSVADELTEGLGPLASHLLHHFFGLQDVVAPVRDSVGTSQPAAFVDSGAVPQADAVRLPVEGKN